MRFDSNKMRQARDRLGLSMEMVGEKADVSKNSVLRAEHGDDIRPVTARRIAQALGVEVAELVEELAVPRVKAPLLPEDEQRRSALDAVGSYWSRRAETHLQEVGDPNSPHFSDVTRATLWLEMVQIEARDYANWGVEHAALLMPREGGLFDASSWGAALSIMGHLLTFHQVVRGAERRIEAMHDQPDELALRRLDRARQEFQESESQFRELQAVGG